MKLLNILSNNFLLAVDDVAVRSAIVLSPRPDFMSHTSAASNDHFHLSNNLGIIFTI